MMRIVRFAVSSMKFLLPPSREHLSRNVRLLAAHWKSGGPQMRYFIASQLLSGMLLGVCSLAGIVAGLAGLTATNLALLGAAAACLLHTVSTWNVLKRRFQVRYEVW